MIINERDLLHQSVVEAAHRMMTAARTAPKAKGVDIIEIALVEEREDLEKLAEAMRRRSEETGFKFLLRDADNILQGEAVILIGTRVTRRALIAVIAVIQPVSRIQRRIRVPSIPSMWASP